MSPTALETMKRRNTKMHSAGSIEAGRTFATRPTDVFVVTYPKCGTTWCTQIAHQLRCLGKEDVVDPMGFGEITEVVPWDILAKDCGQNLDDEHVVEPRVFKSHETWEGVAKGARYVVVVRDPVDVFFSFYNFLPAYMGLAPGELTQEEFADAIFAGASHSGHCWPHFLGWWEQRDKEEVLMICFEDLKVGLTATDSSYWPRHGLNHKTYNSVPASGIYNTMPLCLYQAHYTHSVIQRRPITRAGCGAPCLKDDLRGCALRIAKHMGVELDDPSVRLPRHRIIPYGYMTIIM